MTEKDLMIQDLREKKRKLKEQFAEMEAKSEWIPIRERLPETGMRVLAQWRRYCTDEHYIDILHLDKNGTWCGDVYEPYGKVLAWKPLPERYEEDE